MADYNVYNFLGVNQKLSVLNHQDGELLVCQNLDPHPVGAKTKRCGYITHLGTVAGTVTSIFSWEKPSSGATWEYMSAGSALYHSVEGTGAWTLSPNGTISNGAYVGHAYLDEYLIVGDNVGSTRHTTNGTSFTDTTLAPVGNKFAVYNQRVYLGGTASDMFYSELGSAIGWDTAASNPSSSEPIDGRGNLVSVKNINGEIMASKGGREITHFDFYNKFQNPANEGPAGQQSMAQVVDFWFWLNQNGAYVHDNRPRLISRQMQPFIYNNSGSSIAAGTFASAPAVGYKEDYMIAVGTVTSDIYPETVDNMVMKYHLPSNQWSWYQYADNPTAFHSYTDASGNDILLFGDTGGQVYKTQGTATSDNGTPITASMLGVLTFNAPRRDKLVKSVYAVASAGCGAKFQIAMTNSLDIEEIKWYDVGDLHRGYAEMIPHKPLRGKFMWYKLNERSADDPFTFYGFTVDVDILQR